MQPGSTRRFIQHISSQPAPACAFHAIQGYCGYVTRNARPALGECPTDAYRILNTGSDGCPAAISVVLPCTEMLRVRFIDPHGSWFLKQPLTR